MNELVLLVPVLIISGVLILLVISYRKYKLQQKKIGNQAENAKLQDELVLRRFVALVSTNELRNLKLVVVLVPVIILFLYASVLVAGAGSVGEFIKNASEVIDSETDFVIGLLLMALFAIGYPFFIQKAVDNECLELTKEGITYHSAKIPLLELFMPTWSMQWGNIKSANLEQLGIQARLQLIDNNGNSKHLIVNQWLLTKTGGQSPKLFDQLWQARQQQKDPESIFQWPLIKYIKTKTSVELQFAPTTLGFDLMSHPKTKKILYIMLLIGSYAVVDALINMETYLVIPPLWWFVVGGFIAAIFVFMKVFDATIPASNAIGVAVIFGVVFGIALYPGLLRINQVTDPYGIRSYDYYMGDDGIFRNDDVMLPVIKMSSDKYWRSIDTGQSYTFKLRKGGLGFYQIDMDDVYAKMRKWYCQQKKKQPGNIRVGCD